jgi:hypothetical protein
MSGSAGGGAATFGMIITWVGDIRAGMPSQLVRAVKKIPQVKGDRSRDQQN